MQSSKLVRGLEPQDAGHCATCALLLSKQQQAQQRREPLPPRLRRRGLTRGVLAQAIHNSRFFKKKKKLGLVKAKFPEQIYSPMAVNLF